MPYTRYLDYAATTSIDSRIVKQIERCFCMDGDFGNPSSISHDFGRIAAAKVDRAREQVAKLIGADPREIIFTSGATEADNLAIKGVAEFYQNKGKHIITLKTEHKAVLDTCAALEKRGFEVTYLTPEKDGLLDLNDLEKAIREDTLLVSVMHVNNEIGVIQDIQAIGEICRKHKIFFHVDAAQSVGKIPIDLKKLPVDLLSFSGHKLYGPKGIGVLFVRRKPRVRLEPQMHGGGHEQGLRAGTLPTHQIVGIGAACELAAKQMQQDYKKIKELSIFVISKLREIDGVHINGSLKHRYPGIINFSVEGVDTEALLMRLPYLALSPGSACTSASIEPSYVLTAIGVPDELANSSVRLSLGRYTHISDVQYAMKQIRAQINFLRDLSPLWERRNDV